jgi:small-conductance mechanosensitive channel
MKKGDQLSFNELIPGMTKSLVEITPDLLSAFVVFFCGALVAIFFRKSVFYVVSRMSKSSNDRLARLAKSRYTHSFATTVAKLLFWSALIISASMILQIFGVAVFDEWMKKATTFIPSLLAAVFILVTGFMIARILRDLLSETNILVGFGVKRQMPTILYYVVSALSVLIALQQLGIEIGLLTSSILVVLLCLLGGGAISFGIGSAPIVTDILSSYYLRKRIKVGQHISNNDFSGTVIDIAGTCVLIRSESGVQSIPARQLNSTSFTVSHARN